MVFQRSYRVRYLALAALGVVFGVVLEALLDPLEGTGGAAFGLLAGLVLGGLVAAYWWSRMRDSLPAADERVRTLERRASRVSHGVLVTGVGLVAIVASVPPIPLPTAPSLWALLVGSIGAHELALEYYRRRM